MMRFIRYEKDGAHYLGLESREDGDIVPLSTDQSGELGITDDLIQLIRSGPSVMDAVKRIAVEQKGVIQRSEVKVLAPIVGPDKVICIGMNYRDHCEEQNCEIPKEPVIFNKFPSTIVGPTDDIVYPEETKELDWEVELAVVIGRKCKNVSVEDAIGCVFGYTVAHDVSARDWQLRKNCGQWLLGKTMDTFCPIGPAVVTKEDISDPHNLKLWCRVNGVTKQESSTSQMIFQTEDLVSFLSRFMTLLPGDIILTGTPPGVGIFRKPPEFLKRGDTVECTIAEIGTIKNRVV